MKKATSTGKSSSAKKVTTPNAKKTTQATGKKK